MTDDKKTAHYDKYVVSVELAKRLRACGFAVPTMFFWVANPQLGTVHLYQSTMEYHGPLEYRVPAPTAFEIKEQFPIEVWVTVRQHSLRRCKGLFYFTKYNGVYAVSLMVKGEDTDQLYEFHREEDGTEANACGLMLAYILENNMKAAS